VRAKRSSSGSGDDGLESTSVDAKDRLWEWSRHICSESGQAIVHYDEICNDGSNYGYVNNMSYSGEYAVCRDE